MSTQDQKRPSSYNMFLHANVVCVNNEIVQFRLCSEREVLHFSSSTKAKSLGNCAWITQFTSIGEMLTNLAPAITGQEI